MAEGRGYHGTPPPPAPAPTATATGTSVYIAAGNKILTTISVTTACSCHYLYYPS